jgi:hypothetical protein
MFDLNAKQIEIVQTVHERCVSSCNFLHPYDAKKELLCANDCSKQNKELFRLTNMSDFWLVVAFVILIIAIYIHYQQK